MSIDIQHHWQGTVDDMAHATPSELLRQPIFVVHDDHDPHQHKKRHSIRRVRRVGATLAHLHGGVFILETPTVSFGTHTPEHVDGKVPRYLQIHTARPEQGSGQGGSRFLLRKYVFPTQTDIRDFIPPSPFEKREGEFSNSIEIQHIGSPYSDISLARKMAQKGHNLPTPSDEYSVFVPYGSTAVFINGFGFDTTFITHEVFSAEENTPLTYARRLVTLGRIVGSTLTT